MWFSAVESGSNQSYDKRAEAAEQSWCSRESSHDATIYTYICIYVYICMCFSGIFALPEIFSVLSSSIQLCHRSPSTLSHGGAYTPNAFPVHIGAALYSLFLVAANGSPALNPRQFALPKLGIKKATMARDIVSPCWAREFEGSGGREERARRRQSRG